VTPLSVSTGKAKVTAKYIVIATNFPIINFPGWYFARLYQSRSYLAALDNVSAAGFKLDGYFLSVDKDAKTFRMYKDYLIAGGESHKTGKKGNKNHYGEIKAFTDQVLPGTLFKTQWSAQDCFSLDGLPYIGRYSKKTSNLFVATGFFKWGITNSMVAGTILSDLITKGSSPWAAVYSPLRPMVPAAYAQLIYNVVRFAWNFISGWIMAPFKRTPTCTHMHCKLSHNHDEGTFDCACHGSRFTKEGQVLNCPAKYSLRK
jgi:glycine/D-amino acid oxidase-like deaminating enzyme